MMNCKTRKLMRKFILHPKLSKSFNCNLSIHKLCLWKHKEQFA